MDGQGVWDGQPVSDIDIEIDLTVLSSRLAKDPQFIALVSKAVRDQLLKDVRNKKTLFGKWGGTTK